MQHRADPEQTDEPRRHHPVVLRQCAQCVREPCRIERNPFEVMPRFGIARFGQLRQPKDHGIAGAKQILGTAERVVFGLSLLMGLLRLQTRRQQVRRDGHQHPGPQKGHSRSQWQQRQQRLPPHGSERLGIVDDQMCIRLGDRMTDRHAVSRRCFEPAPMRFGCRAAPVFVGRIPPVLGLPCHTVAHFPFVQRRRRNRIHYDPVPIHQHHALPVGTGHFPGQRLQFGLGRSIGCQVRRLQRADEFAQLFRVGCELTPRALSRVVFA